MVPMSRPRPRPPLVRRPPLPSRYRGPRLLPGSQPLQDLQDFEDIGSLLSGVLGSIPIVGPLVGGLLGGGGGGGAAPAAGGAAGGAGGPMAGIGALLNDPAALATLGGIQGGGAASLLSAIRGNPVANATLGPLANAAIGAGLNGLVPGLGGVLGMGSGGGGLTPDLLQSLLQGRDLSQLQQQAIPRQTAEQVAQTLDPGLAQVRGMLEDQQRSAEATAQHRNIVAEDSFRQSVLAELAAVRADLGRVRDQGPPRW